MRTYTYALADVLKTLIRKEGIADGNWDLGFQIEVGVGAISKTEGELPAPSVIVRITGVSLSEKEQAQPGTIDAATIAAE
ncbi:MAG: hypothetical protein ACYC3S_16390 [Chloroflexota bacterium]